MSALSERQSQELFEATGRYTELQFQFVERKLGLTAILEAADETEVFIQTAAALSDEEWGQYCQEADDQSPEAEERMQALPSFQVGEAEMEFRRKLDNLVGDIGEYRSLSVYPQILILNNCSSPLTPEGNVELSIGTDENGTVSARKTHMCLNRGQKVQQLPVTEADVAALEEAVTKLKEANAQLSQEK